MPSAALGPICAFLSAAIWALASVTYSRLTHSFTAFSVNFSRALIALPIFVGAVWIEAGGFSQGTQAFSLVTVSHLTWFFLSMVASYGLGDSLFFYSTRSLGVPGALAIASTYPLWTTIAGIYDGQESINAWQFGGLLVTLLGVVVVILHGPKGPSEVSGGARPPGEEKPSKLELRAVGVVLAISTSLLWALNNLAVAKGGQGLTSMVGNCIRMAYALGISSAMGKILVPRSSVVLPRTELKRYFPLFALESFGGSFCFMYGLTHSPLVLGSTLTSLAPVIAVPFAWALGMEKLSIFRTLGVAAVVLGLVVLVGVHP
jgi:drug/metabolite transporter (DMT)-like permease